MLLSSCNLVRIALLATLAGLLTIAFAAGVPVKPTDAAGWRNVTLNDLNAMHRLWRDHTPVPFDTVNPAYSRWLEDGYAAALARAAEVSDELGYVYTLTAYASGFNDPHFAVQVNSRPRPKRWPGFVAVLRGETATVVQRDDADPSAPAIGASIESCDGLTLSGLVQTRILPFDMTAGSPERWVISRLFVDFGNPFASLPTTCSVRTGDRLTELSLRWRPISRPTSVAANINNLVIGTNAPWGVTEPWPGVFWIGIPTFGPDEEAVPKILALIDTVKARGEEMRHATAIVIDTRGNGGGSTRWSSQLAEAIFTRDVLKAARDLLPARRESIDRRASRENVAIWRQNALHAEGSSPEERKFIKSAIRNLERAMKRQPPIWRDGSRVPGPSGGLTTLRPKAGTQPFNARVYFLSNGSCGSTCLIFADEVLVVPGVRLIGSVTAGDSFYLEIRNERLPSGLADLTIPQMVMHGRGRGALEEYVPDIAYEGLWDDASVRGWVQSLIEAKL